MIGVRGILLLIPATQRASLPHRAATRAADYTLLDPHLDPRLDHRLDPDYAAARETS
jgi:hypothetical protein